MSGWRPPSSWFAISAATWVKASTHTVRQVGVKSHRLGCLVRRARQLSTNLFNGELMHLQAVTDRLKSGTALWGAPKERAIDQARVIVAADVPNT